MADEEQSLIDLLKSKAMGVSPSVETAFFKVLSKLCGGLLAVPAAHLRPFAQSIEDKTNARSLVAQKLASAVADNAINDPELMRIARDIYLPNELRKTANKIDVARIAVENFCPKEGDALNKEIDEDWFSAFMRFSEDASSERLQILFGRILAGEIVNPGTFSPSTLRTVSELTQEIAKDFEWAQQRRLDDEILRNYEVGENWVRLRRLRDTGLLSPIDGAIHAPPFSVNASGFGMWGIRDCHGNYLNIVLSKPTNYKLPTVSFTSVGHEICKILPLPDTIPVMKRVAHMFSKNNVVQIHLLRHGRAEIIWKRK